MPSINFNGVDLADYNLSIMDAGRDRLERQFESIQLEDRAYSGRRKVLPLLLSLEVAITGNDDDVWILPPIKALSTRNLLTFIKQVFHQSEPCELLLSNMTDRYWLAELKSFDGAFVTPGLFQGSIDFLCEDPRAFSTEETVKNFDIDADPKSIYVGVAGSVYVEPVYLLTAGEALNNVTITIENDTTGALLAWTGDLANGGELEIDVANWLVKKDGIADMATVDGEFPRLNPGTNKIIIDGFGLLGTLTITFREAYL